MKKNVKNNDNIKNTKPIHKTKFKKLNFVILKTESCAINTFGGGSLHAKLYVLHESFHWIKKLLGTFVQKAPQEMIHVEAHYKHQKVDDVLKNFLQNS